MLGRPDAVRKEFPEVVYGARGEVPLIGPFFRRHVVCVFWGGHDEPIVRVTRVVLSVV